jgi:hypothetical protein
MGGPFRFGTYDQSEGFNDMRFVMSIGGVVAPVRSQKC